MLPLDRLPQSETCLLAGELGSLDLITAACPLAEITTQFIGMAAVAADIARGTHDVVVPPWTYPTTLTPMHDIAVNLATIPTTISSLKRQLTTSRR